MGSNSLVLALIVLTAFLQVTGAGAQELRFATTVRGGLCMAGNTLGLSKEFSGNGPGMEDSIGTFIAADDASLDDDPANPTNPWPAGTTRDWTANGSSGELDLPPGSTVQYAELIWGGSYDYFPDDVSASLDSAVTLGHEDGSSTSTTPDPATSMTLSQISSTGFPVNYYLRSAAVTGFVAGHGEGAYTVGGVPGTQGEQQNSLNTAGWTLVVAWSSPEASARYVAISVGGGWVEEGSSVTVAFAGFEAPPSGPIDGLLLLSAMEGDADVVGDEVTFEGNAKSAAVTLSGPNNPADNFFASQLNALDGTLDTRGSFGDRNHDAFNGINVSGGRQGWDRTAVALSDGAGHLEPGGTSATVEARTSGDSYVLAMTALEVETVPEPGELTLGAGALAAILALAGVGRLRRTAAKAGSACCARSAVRRG